MAIFSTEPAVARSFLRKWCGHLSSGEHTYSGCECLATLPKGDGRQISSGTGASYRAAMRLGITAGSKEECVSAKVTYPWLGSTHLKERKREPSHVQDAARMRCQM